MCPLPSSWASAKQLCRPKDIDLEQSDASYHCGCIEMILFVLLGFFCVCINCSNMVICCFHAHKLIVMTNAYITLKVVCLKAIPKL